MPKAYWSSRQCQGITSITLQPNCHLIYESHIQALFIVVKVILFCKFLGLNMLGGEIGRHIQGSLLINIRVITRISIGCLLKCLRLPPPHSSEALSMTQCMQFAHYILQNNEIYLTFHGASTANGGGNSLKLENHDKQ